ncbi:MAG TPA: tripartite tricarboxylate transporter substrate binding protein [Bordetella sp.]
MKSKAIHVIAALLLIICWNVSYAQWTPNGRVELIVAAGSGGGNDRMARVLAKLLQTSGLVPASIIVVNKPGAGGVVAQDYLNSHRGDGRYLMVTNPALITNPVTGIGTAKYTQITPVAQLCTEYVTLVTSADSPFKTGADVIARLKRDPGSLSIAVAPGLGAGTQIAISLVVKAAGIDPAKLRIVPYTSSGQAMTDLLGSHVDLLSTTPMNVLPQFEAGKVRVLGVAAAQPLDGDLGRAPTWRAQGVDAVFGNWRGVVGPDGLKAPELAYWDGVFKKLDALPEWRKELSLEIAQSQYMDSRTSKTFLDDQNNSLTQVLTSVGLAKPAD